ncbi:hypothetical protein MPTK1_3g16420 [Marchantia polymorpha subsp. ruderalis]|uniref:RING-type E3 ubiquitin transferase n=2 Tax=Marchantia polymorpha TaxID=3197 RepID=A0AAF6B1G3_MARPO|nr:hypothetical protein MARPO_0004s0029 [Marchantia polymorpha]BBN05847.1 hypothetical protein Mp_3g16420 [Marchantia polymorpha subsp. ruderalis]|eukprot:PTQ48730.1 hypothetical protein MARPO_0004s0029 [Marchantia polymorpha]
MEAMTANRWAGSLSQRVAKLVPTTRNVSIEKENLAHTLLTHFATLLDALALLLKDMQRDADARSADYKNLQNGKLEEQLEGLENFLESYRDKCNLYLLSNCPQIRKRVQIFSRALSEALESVMQNSWSTEMQLRIAQVKEAFESSSPKLDAKQHAILDSLEPEMLDSVVADSARCTKLVQQIAESFELKLDSDQFAKELSKLKEDKETVENAKGKAQALYLEQFLTLLEKGVVAKIKPASEVGAVPMPLRRELTMRNAPLNTPLQSFICPITRDVMRDPVQIASGQTFEREAIERWFAEGHTRCPLGVELKSTKMKSNIALRQSIAEWKDRNFTIRIQDAEANLQSTSFEDQEKAVQELQRMCEEYSMNKYTIASRGLLRPLVRLAEEQRDLRTKVFAALRILAEDNVENQEVMVEEGLIYLLVRSLARKPEASLQAVLLLSMLSKRPSFSEKISNAHGAVLLLVTELHNENEEIAESVKIILENLPTSDENIVVMAEANFMKPLVTRLVEGGPSSRLAMAKTLATLEMPEESKKQVATEESISTLLEMVQSNDEEEKLSAVEALVQLTTIRQVCVLVATAKTPGPNILVPLLSSAKESVGLRSALANVMANVMTSLADQWVPAEDKEEQIHTLVCKFLSFFFPPQAQCHVLRGLLGLLKGKDTADIAEKMLMENNALTLLVPMLKTNAVEPTIRQHAVQIFAALSETNREAAAAVLLNDARANFSTILSMLRDRNVRMEDSKTVQEQVAALAILANMPLENDLVTLSLLQADCIPVLFKYLDSRQGPIQDEAAGALLRFTAPTGPKDMQLNLAEQGVVQWYVNLLNSSRSSSRERAARALTNFSKSSAKLSVAVTPSGFFHCFRPNISTCPIHKGICRVESNFCLKEADAVPPLLAVIKDGDPLAAEAAIETLLTLVDDDLPSYEPGAHLIAKSKGVPMLINVLNNGTTASQEMAVLLCEIIFRLPEYRAQYGSALQMHVITVAQKGSKKAKQLAGKVLRQLDLLHSQSQYFAQSHPTLE